MASTKPLNAKNLEALGAARLATLLIELSTGNAAAKRRLRLELAGTSGAGQAAAQIAKRLASIAKAKSFIDWRKVKPLAAELDAQRRAIMEHVAPADPREAFELLWRLVACAESVYARSDDGSGRLAAVFQSAVHELGSVAAGAKIAPEPLAERILSALRSNGYGQWDELVDVLAPALGPQGLAHLRQQVTAWASKPVPSLAKGERRIIGYGSTGPLYADDVESVGRKHSAAYVLRRIADLLGDVAGYIALFDAKARTVPAVAAGIAERLLAAGRLQEAWSAVEAVKARDRARAPAEWDAARISVLEALGREDEAQAFRWERFTSTLSEAHLRAYLRKLPDFDDVDAEQRAIAHALSFSDVHRALGFLVTWPALDRASKLVLGRSRELDGDLYEILTPASEVLAKAHPLAATLVLRAMIDFTLRTSRSSRYSHAARHLSECTALAAHIDDWSGHPDHADYVAKLRTAHGRKWGFWSEADRS